MKEEIIVSADAGLTGALCCRNRAGKVVKIIDIPSIRYKVQTKKGEGSRGELDFRALWDLCFELNSEFRVVAFVIEKLAPRGQGTFAAFTLGGSYWTLLMVAAAFGWAVFRYKPDIWKKEIFEGYSKPDKNVSRRLCAERHPELDAELVRVKDHDRAEACLIADYHARKVGWN